MGKGGGGSTPLPTVFAPKNFRHKIPDFSYFKLQMSLLKKNQQILGTLGHQVLVGIFYHVLKNIYTNPKPFIIILRWFFSESVLDIN